MVKLDLLNTVDALRFDTVIFVLNRILSGDSSRQSVEFKQAAFEAVGS